MSMIDKLRYAVRYIKAVYGDDGWSGQTLTYDELRGLLAEIDTLIQECDALRHENAALKREREEDRHV